MEDESRMVEEDRYNTLVIIFGITIDSLCNKGFEKVFTYIRLRIHSHLVILLYTYICILMHFYIHMYINPQWKYLLYQSNKHEILLQNLFIAKMCNSLHWPKSFYQSYCLL